jgi:hypothetical protein
MDIQVGGRAESLDQVDAACIGCTSFKPRLPEQETCDGPVHDAQQRREHLGVRRKQNAQGDRKRHHPLPDWCPRMT